MEVLSFLRVWLESKHFLAFHPIRLGKLHAATDLEKSQGSEWLLDVSEICGIDALWIQIGVTHLGNSSQYVFILDWGLFGKLREKGSERIL